MTIHFLKAAIAGFFIATLGVGCSGQPFNVVGKAKPLLDGPGAGGGDNGTTITLRKIQPALAVRGVACLMCHADIRSNLITDFGYGDPFFLETQTGKMYEAGWYNDYYKTWQTMIELKGSVYVPDAVVPDNIVANMGLVGPLKLDEILNASWQPNWSCWGDNTDTCNRSPMSSKINPADPLAPKVVVKSTITIQAPTRDEILDLAPDLRANADPSAFEQITVKGRNSQPLQGLAVQSGGFVTNSGTVTCDGADVVIKGVLYLKDLNLIAEGGCSLYVTDSVFIEGPVTYLGSDPGRNLQITSARGIFMGMDRAHLQGRLDDRPPQLRAGSLNAQKPTILADADRVGTLKDSSNPAVGYPTAHSYGGATLATFDFTRILLNAPTVQSRYLGKISGVVIAETAMTSLGSFNFEFDSVFMTETALPALKNDILIVK